MPRNALKLVYLYSHTASSSTTPQLHWIPLHAFLPPGAGFLSLVGLSLVCRASSCIPPPYVSLHLHVSLHRMYPYTCMYPSTSCIPPPACIPSPTSPGHCKCLHCHQASLDPLHPHLLNKCTVCFVPVSWLLPLPSPYSIEESYFFLLAAEAAEGRTHS